MPLTEREQRALAQIERGFHTDDPAFAASYRSPEPRLYYGRRLRRGSLLLLAGLALLLLGVVVNQTVVGVSGFIVMLSGGLRVVPSCRYLCRDLAHRLRLLRQTNSRLNRAWVRGPAGR